MAEFDVIADVKSLLVGLPNGRWFDNPDPFADFILNELPNGELLDEYDAELIYKVCKFMQPDKYNLTRKRDVVEIEREFLIDSELNTQGRESVISGSVKRAVGTLVERGSYGISKSEDGVEKFVFVNTDMAMISYFETLAYFGIRAGISEREVGDILGNAKKIRYGGKIPLDDAGLL